MALPLRSEIDAKDKWRIEDLFATDEAWEAEVNRLSELVSKEPEFKGGFVSLMMCCVRQLRPAMSWSVLLRGFMCMPIKNIMKILLIQNIRIMRECRRIF